jgi:hypothetical protein
MLLGHLVAVAVGANLFFLAIVLSSKPTSARVPTKAPWSLLIAISGSIGAIYYMPQTDDETFLPNLLIMHAFLLIPLVEHKVLQFESPVTFTWTYIASAAVALLLRVRSGKPPASTFVDGVQATPLALFLNTHVPTLYFHPAQSSIGWDVIWSTGSFLVWELLNPRATGSDSGVNKLIAVGLAGGLTLLWGAGFAAPVVWAMYA